MFAILLILNACGSHENPAPADPSESVETSEPSEPADSANEETTSNIQEAASQSDTSADTDTDVSEPAVSQESSVYGNA